MIIPISRNNIEMIDVCRPGLQRELDRSDLKECWTVDLLVDHVVNYEAFAFYQEETALSGVFSVVNTPLQKHLYWWWTGKDVTNKTPINYKEVDEFLVAAAEHFGCKRIVCEGRRGWERVSKPFGYSEDGRVYTKKV